VADFPADATELNSSNARMYHPVTPAQIHPASVVVGVRGNPPTILAGPLRRIAASIDPALQLDNVLPLDEVYRQEQRFVRLGALAFGVVALSVLLLSAAGIYALVAFTVAQRHREIGIRAALGADPRQLLIGILSRSLRQLAIGVVLGFAIAALMFGEITNTAVVSGRGAMLFAAVAVLVMAVGVLAAGGPALRGLRIDPVEALRADG
jgi:ABC-type antimicrobial peptide transport system permease subunit